MKTKSVRLSEFNKPLLIEETEINPPSVNMVTVKVHFAGINFYEKLLIEGKYPTNSVLPFTIGGEFSGEIVEVGEGITDFKVGDRVFSLALTGKGTSGGFAQYANIETKYLYRLPEEFSFEQGAAIPMIFFTAYTMLSKKVQMKDGQTVLIHSAAGGVGSTLVKLIKAMYPKTKIIGTYSSLEKEKVLKGLGVDFPINGETDNLSAEIKKIFPEGIDVIFDAVGQKLVSEHLDLIKPLNGIWCTYGAYSGPIVEENLVGKLRSKNATLAGFLMWPLIENKDFCQKQFTEIFEVMKKYNILPEIDKIFPLEQVNEAFERISQRKNIGKVLLSALD
ncbi:MAG: zinc-binding dehydrogenase [Candidatus Shapirobacteria bacterium]|nr:zinc-binding dehydrogenase [Candidatus Shapirobacteria bacterium]